MYFLEKIIHLFIPKESNNHKARILHSSSLIVIASMFVIFQGLMNYLPSLKPDILGFAAQISPEEVVRLTNQKRSEAGLPPLVFNQTLASAAYTKGRDMIDKDYWAHVAPDGTQPWKFFTQFGYRYRYAGENLARDFSNAGSAVEAWMNSPTHRDNILNPKYKEIGIGVTEGDLAGIDTTIIVQFFGATYADNVSVPVAEVKPNATQKAAVVSATPIPLQVNSKPSEVPTLIATNLPQVRAEITSPQSDQQVLISPFNTTRSVSVSVVLLLMVIFILDAFLVSRRRIVRVAGRSFAHIAFLGMILTVILILRSGKIL